MPASPPLARSTVALLVALLAPGCVFPMSVGDGNDEAGDVAAGSSTSESNPLPADSSTGPGVTGPASSTDPTTSADTNTTDETGVLFIEPLDIPGDPECDLWTQDCPRGTKCMPWANDGGNAWNATRCSQLDPDPDAVGEPCTAEESGLSGFDSCALGSMCWDIDLETLEGICVAFCEGDEAAPICEEEGTACTITNDGVLILCLPVCNPAVPDCPEGQGCYPLGDQFLCLPAPTVDPGSVGESCEDIAVCDPGLACVEPQLVPDCTSAGCCSPYCNVTDPSPPCLPGQQCTAWYGPGMAPEGLEDLGVCALPV